MATASAHGLYTYCGLGKFFSLRLNCTGPDCSLLDGFPNITCAHDSSTYTCTNGVTCDGPTNYTAEFFPTLKGGRTSLTETVTDGNLGSFTITSNGTYGSTKLDLGSLSNGSSISQSQLTSSTIHSSSAYESGSVTTSAGQ